MAHIKPNVLFLAALSVLLVFLVAVFAEGEGAFMAVVGLASVALGFFGSVMYALSAPPPNPEVHAGFAVDVINGIDSVADGPAIESTMAAAKASSSRFILVLVLVAAALSVLAMVMPGVPTVAAVGLANATVGMVGGLVGKLCEPEPDTTIPQSAFTAALDAVAK